MYDITPIHLSALELRSLLRDLKYSTPYFEALWKVTKDIEEAAKGTTKAARLIKDQLKIAEEIGKATDHTPIKESIEYLCKMAQEAGTQADQAILAVVNANSIVRAVAAEDARRLLKVQEALEKALSLYYAPYDPNLEMSALPTSKKEAIDMLNSVKQTEEDVRRTMHAVLAELQILATNSTEEALKKLLDRAHQEVFRAYTNELAMQKIIPTEGELARIYLGAEKQASDASENAEALQ